MEHPPLAWVLAGVIFAGALALRSENRMGPYLKPPDFVSLGGPAQAEVKVPSTLRATAALTGFRVPAGHLFWLTEVQYYGDSDNANSRYGLLLDYCLLTADLNPHFAENYLFGAAVLAFHVHRIEEAVRLLNRGIGANPQNIRLKLLLAAIAYMNINDTQKIIPILEAQVSLGDAPPMLVNILANTYRKAGQAQKAIALWQRILRTTTRDDYRGEATRALEQLYAEIKTGKKPR